MEETFNINDIIISKYDKSKKYKIIKINKKTFGCVDEENNELKIHKNDVDFEHYHSIDKDVEYWVEINCLNRKYLYNYKTMNLLFDKLSEYNEITEIFKKQIHDNISTGEYYYEYTTPNRMTYSDITINIYKVDVSDDYDVRNFRPRCTCPAGFKGVGAFCKKHND